MQGQAIVFVLGVNANRLLTRDLGCPFGFVLSLFIAGLAISRLGTCDATDYLRSNS